MSVAKVRLSKWKNRLDGFLFGDLYPVALGVAVLLTWTAGFLFPSLGLFVIYPVVILAFCVLIYALLFHRSFLPIIPTALLIVLSISDPKLDMDESLRSLIWLLILVPVLLAAMVVFFIRNRNNLKRSKTLPAVLVFSVVLFLSGAGSPYYLESGNLTAMLYQAIMYLFFIVVIFAMLPRVDPAYFCKVALVSGTVALLQMAIYYLKVDFLVAINYKRLHLGWAISNIVGLHFVMCIPASLYLYWRYPKWEPLFLLCTLLLFGGVFFTLCRNAMLIAIVITPVLMLYIIAKGQKGVRKRLIIQAVAFLIVVMLALVVATLLYPKLVDVLWRDFTDTGRFKIYREAIEYFLQYPVFGAGYKFPGVHAPPGWLYAAHNTILQFLASGGIVGFCAMLYFFLRRYALFFDAWKPEYIFLLFIVLAAEMFGMLGVFLQPVTMMMSTLCFIVLEKDIQRPARKLLHFQKGSWQINNFENNNTMNGGNQP